MRRVFFLTLLLAAPAFAAPPKLTIPAEVRPSGQYVIVTPETDAVGVLYIGLDGIEPIPSQLLNDKRVFALDTYGKTPGAYRFVAVAAGEKGEQTRTDFILIVPGKPPTPEPIPDPVKPDPVKPDPVTPQAKHITAIIIEETQQRTVAQAKVINDPAVRQWLQTSGHFIDVMDDDDPRAKANGYTPFVERAGGVPVVLLFDADATGPQVPLASFKLPATPAALKAEIEKAVRK